MWIKGLILLSLLLLSGCASISKAVFPPPQLTVKQKLHLILTGHLKVNPVKLTKAGGL